MEVLSPDTLNIIYIALAVAIGWVLLRFIFRLAKRIFAIGCFAIVALAAILFIMQMLNGV